MICPIVAGTAIAIGCVIALMWAVWTQEAYPGD